MNSFTLGSAAPVAGDHDEVCGLVAAVAPQIIRPTTSPAEEKKAFRRPRKASAHQQRPPIENGVLEDVASRNLEIVNDAAREEADPPPVCHDAGMPAADTAAVVAEVDTAAVAETTADHQTLMQVGTRVEVINSGHVYSTRNKLASKLGVRDTWRSGAQYNQCPAGAMGEITAVWKDPKRCSYGLPYTYVAVRLDPSPTNPSGTVLLMEASNVVARSSSYRLPDAAESQRLADKAAAERIADEREYRRLFHPYRFFVVFAVLGFAVRQALAAMLYSDASIVLSGGVVALVPFWLALWSRVKVVSHKTKNPDLSCSNLPCRDDVEMIPWALGTLWLAIMYTALIAIGCFMQMRYCPSTSGIAVASPPGFECAPYICTDKGEEDCTMIHFYRRRLHMHLDTNSPDYPCIAWENPEQGVAWDYFSYKEGMVDQWWERGADKVCDACVANCSAHDDCAAVECHPTKPSRCLMWYHTSLLNHSLPTIHSIASSFLRNVDRTGICNRF
eukprot:COSAG02_NODE_7529_length_2972_cov_2.393665_4_plen_502_part_00